VLAIGLVEKAGVDSQDNLFEFLLVIPALCLVVVVILLLAEMVVENVLPERLTKKVQKVLGVMADRAKLLLRNRGAATAIVPAGNEQLAVSAAKEEARAVIEQTLEGWEQSDIDAVLRKFVKGNANEASSANKKQAPELERPTKDDASPGSETRTAVPSPAHFTKAGENGPMMRELF
jgi:hypothetical protein